jgi:branched-subunit amino acid transport protein
MMSVDAVGTLIVVLVLAAVTYFTRISMIALLGRVHMSQRLDRLLKLTIPAVFTAIVLPNVLTRNGLVHITLADPRPFAALAALAIALKTRSMLWTIVGGMLAYWAWQWLLT